MPVESLIPLIDIAGQQQANLQNTAFQLLTNKAQMKYGLKMYEKQRKDALADWQMQADYNSPANQMKRLRDAGLNPNLVYGHGADAQMNQSVRSSEVQGWNPQAPEFSRGSVLGSYLDTKIKNEQASNLEKQGTLLETENILKAASVAEIMERTKKIGVDTELGKTLLEFKKATMQTLIEQAQANLVKTYADTQFTIDENWRKDQRQQAELKKLAEEVLNLRKQREVNDANIRHIDQQIKNLAAARDVVELENQLREIGIQPGDKPFWRLVLGNLVPRSWKRKGTGNGHELWKGVWKSK